MKEKEYSEVYPKLPKDFDDLEEFVYWGVRNFSLSINDSVKELKNNIKNFDSILESALNEVAENPEAMKILEEKGVLNEYQEGARLYVTKHLNSYSVINEFLEDLPAEFGEKLIKFALKAFFDYLYELYKLAEKEGEPWW